MDITFCELRSKEVININDGKRLGRVCDIVISGESCCVQALIVPSDKRLFRGKEDLIIPWRQVKRIGDDCILVTLYVKPIECAQPQKEKRKGFCDYIIDE